MTNILVYEDTADELEAVAEKNDVGVDYVVSVLMDYLPQAINDAGLVGLDDGEEEGVLDIV